MEKDGYSDFLSSSQSSQSSQSRRASKMAAAYSRKKKKKKTEKVTVKLKNITGYSAFSLTTQKRKHGDQKVRNFMRQSIRPSGHWSAKTYSVTCPAICKYFNTPFCIVL